MKKILLLPIAIIVLFLLGFMYPGNWTKYISEKGRFSIEFPGPPAESIKNDSSNAGQPATIYYASYFPSDSQGYMTDWTDLRKTYPAEKTIKQMLEESRDGALQSIKATYSATTATHLGTDPYIEFSYTSNEFAGKGRIYIINKFQYAIMTLFSIRVGISPDADRFIRSFRRLQ